MGDSNSNGWKNNDDPLKAVEAPSIVNNMKDEDTDTDEVIEESSTEDDANITKAPNSEDESNETALDYPPEDDQDNMESPDDKFDNNQEVSTEPTEEIAGMSDKTQETKLKT